MPTLFKNIEDFVDLEKGKAWLRYSVDGNERFYAIPVDNDWADPATVGSIMKDIERNGNRFYGKLDGQATTWFYLNHETAKALNRNKQRLPNTQFYFGIGSRSGERVERVLARKSPECYDNLPTWL
ncbi:MAG: hypothetical protein NTW52_01535 [Planctomycetota bacterium]|nr:hypothetical protein [Planctomycetota bacterium]